jgi:hypothetical protein
VAGLLLTLLEKAGLLFMADLTKTTAGSVMFGLLIFHPNYLCFASKLPSRVLYYTWLCESFENLVFMHHTLQEPIHREI